MQVTSLDTLRQMKRTDTVKLSSFEDGTEFIVEMKKPNMMQLITSGKVPNTLLSVAMQMFNGGTGELATKATNDAKTLKELVGMMEVLAEACLVAPSYSVLKENNIDLTEQQLMDILTYSQGGVKSLENFRK
ncbi:hypothetical protein [Paraclostridium bifermentans]|uniref:hypothetical protein n=1 Tax=Paraclostridium bifermentans TaxID=1490 RepID=UPI001159FE40|nr:hypothetical protein [Paraclostridium bifermentans]TQO55818.1 hypothetical protein D5S05_16820 [Paraclostridium bifermentans]